MSRSAGIPCCRCYHDHSRRREAQMITIMTYKECEGGSFRKGRLLIGHLDPHARRWALSAGRSRQGRSLQHSNGECIKPQQPQRGIDRPTKAAAICAFGYWSASCEEREGMSIALTNLYVSSTLHEEHDKNSGCSNVNITRGKCSKARLASNPVRLMTTNGKPKSKPILHR